MKELLISLFILFSISIGFAQTNNSPSVFENLEVYFSPFQTRVGGFEYDLKKETESDGFSFSTTKARMISVNDFEVGANYLFCIRKTKFGAGLSFYSDSYKFLYQTGFNNKLYRINRKGLSLNLFYRKEIFQGTSLDLGLNTRVSLFSHTSNRLDYNESGTVTSTVNVLVYENWGYQSFVEFIPSIQFNTNIYKGLYFKYGIFAKFWGKEFYSVIATEKYTSDDVVLDFNVNQSAIKGTIAVGYNFK